MKKRAVRPQTADNKRAERAVRALESIAKSLTSSGVMQRRSLRLAEKSIAKSLTSSGVMQRRSLRLAEKMAKRLDQLAKPPVIKFTPLRPLPTRHQEPSLELFK